MIYCLSTDTFIDWDCSAGKFPVKLRQYDNRLWAVFSDGSIGFSENGDATTGSASNIILLPNREMAIDFIPVQGGVIITHSTGAYALYGSGTYQDTSILPIQSASNDPVLFTDSAVLVDNSVFVLGNRGVYTISLNGVQNIPHNQNRYLNDNYPIWTSPPGVVQGIYLQRFHSILYLFHEGYGTQGVLFNILNGAVQKINIGLPSGLPYMLAMNSKSIDFILGSGGGTAVSKSTYPSGVLITPRDCIIQTRFEDCDSPRDKIFKSIGIVCRGSIPYARIRYYLDGGDIPLDLHIVPGELVSQVPNDILFGFTKLSDGNNIVELYDYSGSMIKGKSISFEITIGSSVYILDESTGRLIIDEVTGSYVVDETPITSPQAFTIRELRLKYCLIGGDE